VDLLYSSGLFDYFDVKQSRRVIARMWECVAPGGRLLIINGHPDNPTRPWMALASDWLLEYKTPEDMRSLVAGLPDMRGVSLERDEHGVYQYLEVLKRG